MTSILPNEEIDKIPDPEEELPELKVYCQNRLFYWWPVWVVGYIMAAITLFAGTSVDEASLNEYIHPSPSLGVLYVFTLFAVIVFTHFSFRGPASLAVIGALIIVALVLTVLDAWRPIFGAVAGLSIHMNLGFYLFVSTLLLLLWAYATFVHVRFDYYRIRPGQISEMKLIGEGETNYDTRGAVVEKYREDLFRHFILGLGSGDIRVSTSGARSEELLIPNVLLVDKTIERIRKLTSVQPDDLMQEQNEDGDGGEGESGDESSREEVSEGKRG